VEVGVWKEVSVSRLRVILLLAVEGEVFGTLISIIWGLPTLVNDTTLAVSSCDFLLEALGEDARVAFASSELVPSSMSVGESS
jgi:hypothetical protein